MKTRSRAKFRQDGEARRSGADHQPSGGRLRARRREDGDRSRPFAQPARRPCLRYTGPQRSGIGVACEGVRVGDSGARDLGPYARRWDRQLRSHAIARRPARRRARITAVRWREHGRSATAAARADANAGLRPACCVWQLRQSVRLLPFHDLTGDQLGNNAICVMRRVGKNSKNNRTAERRGGHRGSFLRSPAESLMGGFALIPQVVDIGSDAPHHQLH